MSWANLDDGFADHRKVIALPDAAFRLHVCAMCWCSRRLTDGLVRSRELRILGAMLEGCPDDQRLQELAQNLVDARLWDPCEEGWRLHDWKLRQKTHHQRRPHRKHRHAVYERDGWACRYCGASQALSLDHVIPPRLGGNHEPGNLVTACRSCNSRKGSRTPAQAGMARHGLA